ncbi:MAG: hypothetical protein EBU66_19970 [Bacteroidetes bacterium]|jgi:hypothetical protein|nr:hypothetical protein [Bacteroidota bacterium]
MSWVAGIRKDILYTVKKRPLDPRWSQQDLQVLLGWCASAQALGWTEQRAFQAAEALVMKKKNHGIVWSNMELLNDMELLLVSGEQHKTE